MAQTLGIRIQALTNFDADNTSDDTFDSVKYNVLTNQWLNDGYREVVNLLPVQLLSPCLTKFEFTSNSTGLESEELKSTKVYNVQAHNGTKFVSCRQINAIDKGNAEDSDSILYATSNDPVFYIEQNKINVLPSNTACEYLTVDYSGMTELAYSDTSISSFPSEAENLVVLYASIKALEYLASFEEDIELYMPVIQNLKQDYGTLIQIIKTGDISKPQKGDK